MGAAMKEGKPDRALRLGLTVLLLVIGMCGVVPAMMSPMLGDDPHSPQIPIVALMLSVGTFPLSCLLAVVVSWGLAFRGRTRASWWAFALPLLNVIVGTLAFGLLFLARRS